MVTNIQRQASNTFLRELENIVHMYRVCNIDYVSSLGSLSSQKFIFSFFSPFSFSVCPFSPLPNLLDDLRPRREVDRDRVVRNTPR